MPQPLEYFLAKITQHWDRKEELCVLCKPWWDAQTLATRKEIKHNYEFEKD